MAMNFFAQQEEARRQTRRLIFWFVLAVLVVAAAMYLVVLVAIKLSLVLFIKKNAFDALPQGSVADFLIGWCHPWFFLAVMVATLLVILVGSFARMRELQKDGGDGLARSLGGVLVTEAGQDPLLRRLLNIVDEMAIAAGIPPPPVYVLVESAGINAFAAGFTPETAVVAVTRGALEKLDRDELQGVVAHEFSHIINGDMLLNLRLLGMAAGIEMLALYGEKMMEVVYDDGDGDSFWGTRNRQNGRINLLFWVVGIAVYLLGSVGGWMAQLIKAAVSRQREFLADAAAVQFTRNPEGLGRALRKIRGLSVSETRQRAEVAAVSHMFFSASDLCLFTIMESHPPLETRIRNLLPEGETAAIYPGVLMALGRTWLEKALLSLPRRARMAVTLPPLSPDQVVKKLSGSDEDPAAAAAVAANWAAKMRQGLLPDPLRLALRNPAAARAAVLGLMGGPRPPFLVGLDPRFRLLALDFSLTALRQLPPEDQRALRAEAQALADADAEITLFEYAVLRILDRAIGDAAVLGEADKVRYYSFSEVRPACETLVSTMSWVGANGKQTEAERIFNLGLSRLGTSTIGVNGILPSEACTLEAIDQAMKTLGHMPAPMKQKLVDAGLVCMGADRKIGEDEAELVRAVAAALGCRQPPVLPGDNV